MYVDYGYYVNLYGGSSISEEDFQVFAHKAEVYIRKLTYVRGDIFAVENDVVKDAVCAVADVYHNILNTQSNGVVKSENNDGYSVTYVTEQSEGQTSEELFRKKAYEVACAYLLPTGWLNRKVGCHCDRQCRHNDLQPRI